jgi:hypothetical protein
VSRPGQAGHDDHSYGITEYLHFDTYINDFIDEIGDVFNALLEHVDATLVPVQSHRAAFLKFVRDHDLRCVGPFYSAYPQRTVLDIVDTPSLVG